jgi:alkanesulfonate monooxygenase SsuD/methylene tetrahydromethanopterin reductase-like flavin-dependent oxidoreductase (luciferase family)
MIVGFLSEGELLDGHTSYYHRYQELIREVLLAEEVGFDLFAASEQHFMHGATISAPECLFSHLIPLTRRIRFLYAIALTPYRVNHPLRIAERVAMQDVLSGGRMELGTGRSNATLTVKAFEFDPDETKRQWKEAIDVIRAAWRDEPFSYDGEFFKIPRRYLVPRPLQQPHPPLSVAASSPESHAAAAHEGLGALSGASFFGWRWLEALADSYWTAARSANGAAAGSYSYTPLFYTCCAETDEEAWRIGGESLKRTARFSLRGYARLAQQYPSYAYMAKAEEMDELVTDPEWLGNESGSVLCGSPETLVRQLRRVQELGATGVLLRVDGLPHRRVMQTIELIGKEVLPHVKPEFARPSAAMVESVVR